MEKTCEQCGIISTMTCGGCKKIVYCGLEHQKKHWKKHKENCLPYSVIQNKEGGRFFIASRDLPAGYLLIQEPPVLIGPTANSNLVCLSCHNLVSKKVFRCLKCKWPMCSEICANSSEHREECEVLSQDVKLCGVPRVQGETPRYDLILILRCLLQKKLNNSLWKKIQTLESHKDSRKKDEEPHHMAAVKYFTSVCTLNEVDEDTIHHVRGVILTNGVNTKSPHGVSLRGLYPTISLLNHSCYPNISLRSNREHAIFVRTAVKISKGEPLYFSYVPTMDPFWIRQSDLRDVYYFSCKCKRCTDPTELGTYFSSPKCPECNVGFLQRITENLENQVSFSKCSNCKFSQNFADILKNFEDNFEQIKNKKLNKHFELFLKDILEKNHRNSYIYFEALQKCYKYLKENFTFLGPSCSTFSEVSAKSFNIKCEIIRKIIELISIFEPGMTRKRGVLLCDLASINYRILKKIKNESSEFKNMLKESIKISQESMKILKLEPFNSDLEDWIRMSEATFKSLEKL